MVVLRFQISELQLLKNEEALSDYIIDIDTAMIKIPKPLSP